MRIKFKTLTISNLMGFGNNLTTINLDNPGMTLVTGPNGSGKSTIILESLSFICFGKPYRKTKIGELLNRKNKKKLYGKLEFEADNNTYILERGLKPNILSISRNGEALDILSTKALTQDEIDRILGINHDMFKNIVGLSLSYNKPFLTLPAMDKRSYIENIFNIKIFSDMLSLIKKENTDIKIRNDINDKALSIMEQNMKSQRTNIKNIKNTLTTFEKEKSKEISTINTCISKIDHDITFIQNKLSKLSFEELTTSNTELKVYLSTSNDRYSELKYKIASVKKDLTFYSENEICPTCMVPIDSEKRANNIKNNNAELAKLIREYETIDKHINKIEEKINKNNTSLDLIKTYTRDLSYNEKELNNYKDRLDVATKRELSNIDMTKLYGELEEKSKEYAGLYKSVSDDKDTARINNIIQAILQDDGIKTYFIQQLLPILNERINHYLNMFELPLVFSFNERMEETIKSLEHYKDDISYYSHSEGEKKRLDLAILLSFIDLTKRISNWSCNLLVLDELLDSAVDGDGLDQILFCIRGLTKEDQNLSCYIISHRLIEDTFFNNRIQIIKSDGYSSII